MANIVPFLPLAATTTRFTPSVENRKLPAPPARGAPEPKTVSLSWVVVTDNGRRHLRMLWTINRRSR